MESFTLSMEDSMLGAAETKSREELPFGGEEKGEEKDETLLAEVERHIVFGDVKYWGAATGGEIQEVASLAGFRLTSVAVNPLSEAAVAVAPAAERSLQWITGAPESKEQAQAIVDVANEMKAVEVACGKAHHLMTTEDGSLFSWGSSSHGQLGFTPTITADEPELVTHLQSDFVASASCGGEHSFAVTSNGDIYAWGRSSEGQTGFGMNATATAIAGKGNNYQPVPRFCFAFSGIPVRQVAAGPCYSILVTCSGQLWSWGEGRCGQLGTGMISKRNTPELVLEKDPSDGSPFVQLACGWGHVLARSNSDNVYGWGLNMYGELGMGNNKARYKPEQLHQPDGDGVTDKPFKASTISAGYHHSAAIQDGKVWTWGHGGDGRLGYVRSESFVPRPVADVNDRNHSGVYCTRTATIAVAVPRFERISVANGYTSGNTRVGLMGAGVQGLARPGGKDMEPGAIIPGVVVRFTRPERAPSVDLDADDDASIDSQYLRDLEELVLTVPALVPLEGSEAEIECLTPAFPGPCKVNITISVDDKFTVEGSQEYSFYDPPQLDEFSPSLLWLGGGEGVTIGGNGLFGCMLADPAWRVDAEAYMEKVTREQEEIDKLAKKSKARADERREARRQEVVPLMSPRGASELKIRFTLTVNDEPAAGLEPVIVPASYRPRFVENEEEDADEYAEEEWDGEGGGEEGTLTADMCCTMPELVLPDTVAADMARGVATKLAVSTQVAISGDAYIPGPTIPALYFEAHDMTPNLGPATGGTIITLKGMGFLADQPATVRFSTSEPAWNADVEATYVDACTLRCTVPPVSLPASAAPSAAAGAGEGAGADAEGKGDDTIAGKAAFDVAVSLRPDDWQPATGKFNAYAGSLDKSTPLCGPMSGGTVVTLSPPESQRGWLFDCEHTMARIFNDQIELFVRPELTESGDLKITMPALPQAPPVEDEPEPEPEPEGDGEGKDEGEGEGGGEGEGDEENVEGKVEVDEEEGAVPEPAQEEKKAEPEPPKDDGSGNGARPSEKLEMEVTEAVDSNVNIAVTIDGYQYLPQEFKFEYYDLEGAYLVDATPPQVVVGDEITLIGVGWLGGSRRPIQVQVITQEEGTVTTECEPAVVVEKEEGDESEGPQQWRVVFPCPTITVEDPDAEDAKKKKKAKVRPIWFKLSFDGSNFFGTKDDEDVHIQAKDPA